MSRPTPAFRWPALERFNWALDYFDVYARGNDRVALWVVDDEGGETKLSFSQLAERSNRVANYLRGCGVRRGDRVLVMLPNVAPLWEIMLAAIKLGAVVSPASTLLSAAELQDRIERGEMRHVVADAPSSGRFAEVPGDYTRIVVGEEVAGWRSYAAPRRRPRASSRTVPRKRIIPSCCTSLRGPRRSPRWCSTPIRAIRSGTSRRCTGSACARGTCTSTSALPVGRSTPGAAFSHRGTRGATIFIHQLPRFDGRKTLAALVRHGVTTLCAPPTVWRC